MPDDRERLQIDGRNFSHGRQSDFFSLYTKCKLDVSKTVFWKTPVKWLWLSLWKRQLNGSDCHCENRCFEKDNVSGTLSSSTFSTQPVCKMLQESSIAACQLFCVYTTHWQEGGGLLLWRCPEREISRSANTVVTLYFKKPTGYLHHLVINGFNTCSTLLYVHLLTT